MEKKFRSDQYFEMLFNTYACSQRMCLPFQLSDNHDWNYGNTYFMSNSDYDGKIVREMGTRSLQIYNLWNANMLFSSHVPL